MAIEKFNSHLNQFNKTDTFELSDLVDCLSIDDQANNLMLDSHIRNFDDIDKNNLDLIGDIIRISSNNTFLFYFIREETSKLKV